MEIVQSRLSFPVDTLLEEWYAVDPDTVWTNEKRETKVIKGGDLAFILDRKSGATLLVLVHVEKDGCLYCEHLVRLRLYRRTRSWIEEHSPKGFLQNFENDGPESYYGEVLPDDQLWMVD